MALVTNYYDPGPTNVQIPAATSLLHVEFSRNVMSFALNRYMQIIGGQRVVGLYAELSSNDPVTVITQEDHIWPDGQERPAGRKRPFRWKEWNCERRTYTYTLGGLTVDQATFDIVAAHGRSEAARAMTDRTIDALTVLETSGNWGSNTSATLDALGVATGTWVTSSTTAANQFIKKSFNLVKQKIAQATGGVVTGDQLVCIVNPNTAGNMATSPEIREYMVNHEKAYGVLEGMEKRIVDSWGLPPNLYGVTMVVEDAVKETLQREIDGTSTVTYVMSDNVAVFTSRVGGLAGVGAPNQANAAPSFTTLTGFFHEEMNVETEVKGFDRLLKGAVTDNRDIVLTAPNSGWLLQDVST